jgi:hypothetical protein
VRGGAAQMADEGGLQGACSGDEAG